MSLVELIGQADERGLAASGLACLDRCLPLLGADDELLRPLWAGLAEDGYAGRWGELWEQVRSKAGDAGTSGDEEAVLLARRMLAAAPAEPSAAEVRVWADACSVASLRIHRLLEVAAPREADTSSVDARREGRTEGMSPLVSAELRRQIVVLELLAEHGVGGLRRVLEVSTEGRRVLRAVVSRRARGRG
ncbi:hypothetical protein K4B79_10735 [Streptomyces lincolnensis]|uniref:hypothetical protein n=1 Tax=Streptomyces lincolnensis TaxID=1915 RepID=UPI001E2C0C64|nr:hypothetical protein [Streptomyces lincolnensis]MCD7438696.1 hypothetical protein [Streptomyces lincolnensis]